MLPTTMLCENGIDYSVASDHYGDHLDGRGSVAIRADYRGPSLEKSLDRGNARLHSQRPLKAIFDLEPAIEDFVAQVVTRHIAERAPKAGEREWIYKQRLIDVFPLESFWKRLPETTPMLSAGSATLRSLAEIAALPAVEVVHSTGSICYWSDREEARVAMNKSQNTIARQRGQVAAILGSDLELFAAMTRRTIFEDREPVRAEMCGGSVIALQFERRGGATRHRLASKSFYRLPISSYAGVGIALHGLISQHDACVVLNSNHPLIAWLSTAERMAESGVGGLDKAAFGTLIDLIVDATGHGLPEHVASVNRYLDSWRALPSISDKEKPPPVVREEFTQPR